MHIKPLWSYFNKGLLIILGFLIASTIMSVIYLAHSLLQIRQLLTQGTNAVATALVLQDLVINVQDAQSGARGYVLTGNANFLKTYTTGKSRIPSDLAMIKGGKNVLLTPAERDKIASLVSQRVTMTAQNVETYDNQGFAAAQAAIATGSGETLTTELRNYIAGVSSNNLKNIGPMDRSSIASVRTALWVSATMIFLILCTSGAILWYFRRAILHERALESTKNEFLSLASHQLRTPATNVKQYVALLLDGYMGELTEEQKRALEVAYKNNEAEIRIMNTLLDVAKLDLDRIELHKKVVNFAKLVRRAVRDYTPPAQEAGLAITADIPSQLMATIDEGYIEGVVDNLLDNAIKYSKPGTKISVKVWRDEDMACISVRDQGLGIHRRDLTRLFTKFTRLDNEFSASSQGSGLGLYWVKKVVGLHHGKVELASRENKGSVFTVRLPVR